jgi:pimeloyl-ACP methyl ester carboxylesterase
MASFFVPLPLRCASILSPERPNRKISFAACNDPSVPREGQVDLQDGGSAAWRDWGDPSGPAVVFLHGRPGSRLFVPQASPAGVRVVTFDRPGYGPSTPLAVPSLSAVAEIVTRLADALALGKFAVVGFSGGGPYALACGALLPDRFERRSTLARSQRVSRLHRPRRCGRRSLAGRLALAAHPRTRLR